MSWSPLALSPRKSSNALLIEQVSRVLLPQLRERYAAGQRLSFGSTEVDQEGLHCQGYQSIRWADVVDVRLADDWLSLYYDGKWRTYPPAWFAFSPQAYKKEQPKTPTKRPNLPLLVQLIREEILTQSKASQLPTTPREPEAEPELDTDSVLVMPLAVALQREPRQIQRVAAAHAWQKRHRLPITELVVILVSPFVLTGGLILGLVIYQQQHEAALRAQVSALVHQRYYTVAPGEQCASGPGHWSNDPPPSIFHCLDEGLEIIQPATSQEAGTFLSFDPGDYDHVGLTGDFFPAHYQMQVNVTFGEDPNDVCASLWVHVQKNEGHQEFDICATGDWLEGHCDAYCEHFTLLARGVLPDPAPFLIVGIEVLPDEQRLCVDGSLITTIFDSMYQRTDSLAVLVYNGTPDSKHEVSATFADFSYTPLPSPY